MIITLSVPDETYKQYLEQSKTSPQKVMEQVLKTYAGVAAGERFVMLSKEQKGRLERVFDGPASDLDALLARVEQLRQIKADEVEIHLTVGQQTRLMSEAKFYLKPYPEYVKERIRIILMKELG